MLNMENRRERFQRVASKRINEIIDKIRILWNCANKSAYEYTEDDINKIFRAINEQLKDTRSRFTIRKKEFKL